MNPPSGNGLLSFQVSRFLDTWLMMVDGMTLFGKGVLLPGRRMARLTAGLASLGYQRLPGWRISEKSPARMASVGTDASAGVARRSRRASQLNSQNVFSRTIGPDSTVPYWFRRSLFFGWSGGRKNPRASNISLRTNSNTVP